MLSKCYIYAVFALAAQTKFAFAEEPVDWSITFSDNSTAAVSDAEGIRITQTYVVGNDQHIKVEVFDYECVTKDDEVVFQPSFTFEEVNGKFEVDVTVDIEEGQIMGSTYWDEGAGQLKLCVKVELWSNAVAVSFYETQVELNVEMTVNFDESVSVTKLVPETLTTSTDLWYDIHACLCYADDTTCSSTPMIRQNEQFSICLSPTAPEVAIMSVTKFDLKQDEVTVSSPIIDSQPDALSRVAVNGTVHTLTTWSLSSFYEAETPTPVTASGELELAFVEAAQAERRLRIVDSKGRRVLTTDTGSFAITLELAYDPEYAESSGERMIYGFASVLLVLFISSLSF